MTTERVLNNEYVFDYNIVLELCPEYKKYFDVIAYEPSAPFREDAIYTRHNDDTTDEEMDVINMLHGDPHQAVPLVQDGRLNVDDGRFDITDDECRSSNEKPVYDLKAEYYHYPNRPMRMDVPQLAPPKNVLGIGSKIWAGENVHYTISGNQYRDGSVGATRNTLTDHPHEDKIRLLKTVFWFDRVKDIMSEDKEKTQCVVYNKKTKLLHTWFWKPSTYVKIPGKRRKFYRSVSTLLFNYRILTSTFSIDDKYHGLVTKFMGMLEQEVRKDIPDVYIPTLPPYNNVKRIKAPVSQYEMYGQRAVALVLQQRIGKRIEWLGGTVLRFICDLSANYGVDETLKKGGDAYETPAEYAKLQRKRMRNIVPKLKKRTSLTYLLRTMYGEYYKGIVLKLVTANISVIAVNQFIAALNNDTVPNIAYHWIVELSKCPDRQLTGNTDILTEVIAAASNNHTPRDREILPGWVKFCKRFTDVSLPLPRYHTWLDMYTMADELSVRIRPNKLNNADDVKELHDRLSTIRNRDANIIKEFAGMEFLGFTHPTKEYGGFKFEFLNTPEKLIEEGTNMHHCVGGYARACSRGLSVIFSMRKGDRGYITIELAGNDYQIRQKYTIHDYTVENEEILTIVERWHKDVLHLHKEDDLNYQTMCDIRIKEKQEERLDKDVCDLFEGGGGMVPAPPRALATEGPF